MIFRIGDTDHKLNFGVRFVALLDETETIKPKDVEGIEFGIGLALAEERLSMGSFATLVNVLECALHRDYVTKDEVYDALDAYAEKDELETLFDKVEAELKNSNAVRAAKAQLEKSNQEANRKKGAQVATLTKK